MTAFAALGVVQVTRLHLVVPYLGLWHADITLATATDATGPQVLALSGSTWTGAIVRAVDYAGERHVRIVAGAGGWRRAVPAQQYASPAGVPTRTVIADAAAAVGEPPPSLAPQVPATVGTGYVRQAGPASLVLDDMQDRGVVAWWADPSGVVQTMARPATTIASPFVAEAVRGYAGWYRITTETPGDWMPGAAFSGPTVSGVVSRVEHRVEHGRFWTEVLVP